jgi:hypothetical protein
MFTRNRPDPDGDLASTFRDRIGRLERPERHAADAAMVRICLARSRTVGLRERIGLERLGSARPA